MKKRSITDKEISLIKAMLDRRMKNKDIQFFFNRPERPVNSGRITGIVNGSYSGSAGIDKATDVELDGFISEHTPDDTTAQLSVPAAFAPTKDADPLDDETVAAMFQEGEDGSWYFQHEESDIHECKENFGFKHSDKWLRAIAALSNNRGGYIIFGVKDKNIVDGKPASDSYRALGLTSTDFENADAADFSKQVKSTFDPTPRVRTRIFQVGEAKLGMMYVAAHPSRPIIATKSSSSIKEGDIFFRYPGQSARIKYSDFRTILDDRDRQSRVDMLPMLRELLRLGPANAMIADLNKGVLSGDGTVFRIEEDLIDQINFIKQGEFDESEGQPTLRLIGDLEAVSRDGEVIRRSFATPSDLLRDFLALKTPYDPREYIRCAVEGGNGAWLPIHFYAEKAGMTAADLVEFIDRVNAPTKRKYVYSDRASGTTTAYKAAGGEGAKFLSDLEAGILPQIETLKDATNVGRAIAALKKKPTLSLEALLSVVQSSWDIIAKSDKATSLMSVVRRAIARLDELYYRVE